jgi:hypothetical protein
MEDYWNLWPTGRLREKMFIRELKSLRQSAGTQWLLIRDFNLICKAQDKNNGRLNRSLMLRFRKALDHLGVKEINLVGKKFTWSNNQIPPTMTRIDRAFCSPECENWHANPLLQAFSSSTSNHCPLYLVPLVTPKVSPRFRFEPFWVQQDGFLEVVSEAWNKDTPQTFNPLLTLHVKLSRTAKALSA